MQTKHLTDVISIPDENAQQNNRKELFNLIKDFYENLTVNIELNVEWLNALLLQWTTKNNKKEQDVWYNVSLQCCTGISSQGKKTKKREEREVRGEEREPK